MEKNKIKSATSGINSGNTTVYFIWFFFYCFCHRDLLCNLFYYTCLCSYKFIFFLAFFSWVIQSHSVLPLITGNSVLRWSWSTIKPQHLCRVRLKIWPTKYFPLWEINSVKEIRMTLTLYCLEKFKIRLFLWLRKCPNIVIVFMLYRNIYICNI